MRLILRNIETELQARQAVKSAFDLQEKDYTQCAYQFVADAYFVSRTKTGLSVVREIVE